MSRIKPILFNTDDVRATLDERKTVTRRVIKPYPQGYFEVNEEPLYIYDTSLGQRRIYSPYQPGDILYVRESWNTKCYNCEFECHMACNAPYYVYRANINEQGDMMKWRPSIHMPKEAARLWLKVTDVRAERLQDMSHDAPMKEGIHFCECPDGFTWKEHTDMQNCYLNPMGAMKALWNSTIKKKDLLCYGWNANPWVWVITFERCEKPEEV